ncbi:hypothetical protein PR048_026201 [Dryococelus australis]|uniref:RNA-directed DNA polymerase n=1 Tax=Dryococelus australis TaxID=614101 RepID=A0ABQ9GKN6_9NEOP|nr:hypothetical protein PR048_026201 [Dryococelus australis]
MASDGDGKLLIKYCEQGWPVVKDIPLCVQGYYAPSDRIVLDNWLLFINDKLIVPESSRLGMLLTLHKSHFEMTKMKSKARQVLYWSKMSQDIEVFETKCCACQKFAVSRPREPLLAHERSSLPFNKIWAIFLLLEGSCVNYKGYRQRRLMRHLKVFATHGIQKLAIADNVPFWSRECLLLAQEWGFTIVTSGPRYPHSNGIADRAVQTAKRWQLDRTCTLAVSLVNDVRHISLAIGNINESESQVTVTLLRLVVVDNFEEQLKKITRKSKLSYEREVRPG